MPILRSKNNIVLFSHIPKCGGTSIEEYCFQAGLKIAFFDNAFYTKTPTNRWSINSPQHIDGASLKRLFPEDFFDACFSIVRQPTDRLRSAFLYQKHKRKKFDINLTLSDFIKNEFKQNALLLGYHDNHFLPQHKFLTSGHQYKIFKLENGLSNVKKFIDTNLFGAETGIEIGHTNKSNKMRNTNTAEIYLDEEAKTIITQVYEEDFLKFNYSTDF